MIQGAQNFDQQQRKKESSAAKNNNILDESGDTSDQKDKKSSSKRKKSAKKSSTADNDSKMPVEQLTSHVLSSAEAVIVKAVNHQIIVFSPLIIHVVLNIFQM